MKPANDNKDGDPILSIDLNGPIGDQSPDLMRRIIGQAIGLDDEAYAALRKRPVARLNSETGEVTFCKAPHLRPV